ncbi:hypothetical protein [Streptomyces microflavus]
MDTSTGALATKPFDITEEGLASTADQLGGPAEFPQNQEHPGLWKLPDA